MKKFKPGIEEKRAKRDFDEAIGEFLKDARVKKNISQKDVADKCGLETAQFISNIERGQCAIPPYILRVMISEYGINNNEFLDFLVHKKMEYYKKVLTTNKAKISRR